MKFVLGLAMSAALCSAAAAQDAAPVSTQTAATVAPTPAAEPAAASVVATASAGEERIVSGSLIVVQIAEALSSKVNKQGDKFVIQLAQPIATADGILVPSGTKGVGEIVSASKAGAFGKAGELVVAARYLDFNGQQIPLKALKLAAAGQNNSTAIGVGAMLAPLPIAIALLAVHGGNIDIPVGTLATAKVAGDVLLPVQSRPTDATSTPAPAPAPAPATTPAATSDQPVREPNEQPS